MYSHFQFYTNNAQIIQVLGSSHYPVQLESTSLNSSYSVSWHTTSVPFTARLSVHGDLAFNKFGYAFFVFCLIAFILALCVRVIIGKLTIYEELLTPVASVALKEDLAVFKRIAGHVFRPPSCLLLFTVWVSTGAQLLATALLTFLLLLLYPVYAERGYATSMLVTVYSLCALVGGLRSSSYYLQNKGRWWVTTQLLSFLSLPCLVAEVVLSVQAASPALPTLSIKELRVFLLFGGSLHVLGAVLGRKYLSNPNYPCKVSLAQEPTCFKKDGSSIHLSSSPSQVISLSGPCSF